MKVSAVLSAVLIASVASAYRVDLWENDGYKGAQRSFSSNGVHSLPFAAKSWKWMSSFGDGCCVVFCRGSVNVGKYCSMASNPSSSAGVNKVVTGCDGDVLNC